MWWIIGGCLLLMVILFIIIHFMFINTNYYKNLNYYKNKIKTIKNDLDCLVLGSGPALYDIDEKVLSENSYNLSFAPCSMEYINKLYFEYKAKIKEDGIIIIIILCPFNFAYNSSRNNPNYGMRFSGVLPKEKIKNYSFVRNLISKFPYLRHPKLLFKIIKDDKPFNLNNQKVSNIQESTDLTVLNWKRQAEVSDCLSKVIELEEKQIKSFEKNINFMNEIVESANQDGRDVFFVIPPFVKDIYPQISDEFMQAYFFDQLASIKGKYNVLNYLKNEEFSQDKYFSSAAFMNKNGREEFSEKIRKDIDAHYGKN